MDVSGDGAADMVYRTDSSGRLLLRKGIAASGGGTDLNSLASAANSSGKADPSTVPPAGTPPTFRC